MWVTGEYFDSFRAAQLAARGRLDAPAQADPLLRLEWFQRTATHAAADARPLIVRARSGQTEVWLFLARSRPNRAAALVGPHSTHFGPVFAGDPDGPTRRALLSAAARRLRNFGIARLTLQPLLPEDAAMLRQAFRSGGWTVADRAGEANFLLETAGRSFEDIWEEASPRLHEQLAAGSRLNVEITDLVTPKLWEEVELVGGPDPFLRALAQDASVDRTLRLGIARVGDAPVAAQLWTVENGEALAHWRVEDRDARRLHPSAELTASLLRYLINVDHAQVINLGNGREADLADWADQRRILRRLDLFNPRAPSAWAPALAASAAGLVRRGPVD